MTIDKSPSSPTVWPAVRHLGRPHHDGPGGRCNEVISFCDTRAAASSPTRRLRRCRQLEQPGRSSARISTRVAATSPPTPPSVPTGRSTSPGGTTQREQPISDRHVRSRCARDCGSAAGLGHRPDRRVAVPVHTRRSGSCRSPCPTLAQPGGRAAPVPSIAVDHPAERQRAHLRRRGATSSTQRHAPAAHDPNRVAAGTPPRTRFDSLRGERARLRNAHDRHHDACRLAICAAPNDHRRRGRPLVPVGGGRPVAPGRPTSTCTPPVDDATRHDGEVLRARRASPGPARTPRELRAADAGLRLTRTDYCRPGRAAGSATTTATTTGLDAAAGGVACRRLGASGPVSSPTTRTSTST